MSGGQSSQGSTSKLDPEVKKAYLENYTGAKNVASNLGVREFAGFTPEQQAGFDIVSNTATNMPGMKSVNTAIDTATRVGSLTPEQLSGGSILNKNLQAYMNPYTGEVIDRAMSDIGRQRDIAMQGEASRANAAKAFGGSRQAVAEVLGQEQYGRQMADTAAQLREKAFTNATGLATSDIERDTQARQMAANLGLSSANQLAQYGGQQQAMGYEAGKQIADVGATKQGFSQAQMDAYRNLPLEQQQIINQALSLNPAGGAGNVSTSSGGSKQSVFGWLGL